MVSVSPGLALLISWRLAQLILEFSLRETYQSKTLATIAASSGNDRQYSIDQIYDYHTPLGCRSLILLAYFRRFYRHFEQNPE
jgi:hypothetical protein